MSNSDAEEFESKNQRNSIGFPEECDECGRRIAITGHDRDCPNREGDDE